VGESDRPLGCEAVSDPYECLVAKGIAGSALPEGRKGSPAGRT
jgi:hypothetical protein